MHARARLCKLGPGSHSISANRSGQKFQAFGGIGSQARLDQGKLGRPQLREHPCEGPGKLPSVALRVRKLQQAVEGFAGHELGPRQILCTADRGKPSPWYGLQLFGFSWRILAACATENAGRSMWACCWNYPGAVIMVTSMPAGLRAMLTDMAASNMTCPSQQPVLRCFSSRLQGMAPVQ